MTLITRSSVSRTPCPIDVLHPSIEDLPHAQTYEITLRAQNRLGQSRNTSSARVQTDDVPIEREGSCALFRANGMMTLSFQISRTLNMPVSIFRTERSIID
jgi:hypothetical protein